LGQKLSDMTVFWPQFYIRTMDNKYRDSDRNFHMAAAGTIIIGGGGYALFRYIHTYILYTIILKCIVVTQKSSQHTTRITMKNLRISGRGVAGNLKKVNFPAWDPSTTADTLFSGIEQTLFSRVQTAVDLHRYTHVHSKIFVNTDYWPTTTSVVGIIILHYNMCTRDPA